MKSEFIFVTGGQRSGKSLFAERLALGKSDSPKYIATAQVLDDEMRKRVDVHQLRRGGRWTTFEEPLHIGGVPLQPGDVALMDCVTMWASNCFFRFEENIENAMEFMRGELAALADKGATIIFVSNEIGLGGVSENAMMRRFTDLQGMINQRVASMSCEAHLIVSGIDVRIM